MLWADASRCLIMLSWLKWPVCSQASFPSPNVTVYILLGKLFQSIPTMELIPIPEPILIQVLVPTPGLIPEPTPELRSQASSLISALIQHRGNLFPLLITENCTDRENERKDSVTSPSWRTPLLDALRHWHKNENKMPWKCWERSIQVWVLTVALEAEECVMFQTGFWLWWAHAKETLGFKGKGWIWQNEEREETSFLQGSPWRSDCCLWFQRKVCKVQLMFGGDEKLWKVFVCFGINLCPSSCHCAHAQEPLHACLSVFAPMTRGLKNSEILKETVMKQVTFLQL